MAGPYTRSASELSAGAGGTKGGKPSKKLAVSKRTQQQRADADASYLRQLQDLIYGSGSVGAGGGGGGSSGGGGGGGYGGGPSAYEQWQIEQEKRRQAELDRRKLELTSGLNAARNQAMPLLDQYSRQYNKDIGNVFAQNRALNSGYSRQLTDVRNQMNQGMNDQQAMLLRDLQGQGAGAGDIAAMRAGAQQGIAGNNQLNSLGQMYNTRLAQAMAMAQADAQSMGAAINASSRGNLQNSYANALAQIGLIGLT